MVNQALPSLEELKAVVDEAHRRGMFVASHTYGGDGLKWAIEAGVDDIRHALAATDEDIKMILQKNLPITATILDQRQDEPGDLKRWEPYSRWRLLAGLLFERVFREGVNFAKPQISSRTIPADFPHFCGVFITLSHFFSVPRSVSKALSNLDTVEVTDSSSVGPMDSTVGLVPSDKSPRDFISSVESVSRFPTP
jgi:hypothetical protein